MNFLHCVKNCKKLKKPLIRLERHGYFGYNTVIALQNERKGMKRMSSSKAKIKRQLDKEQGGVDKRAAEMLEKQKAKKKTRKLAIIVVAIIVALLVIAVVLNSKFIRRDFTAVKVGDMEFSAAEYEFFYHNCYYDYYSYVYSSEMANYASMLLPQSGTPHASQSYRDGQTWKDFFDEYTFENLSRYVGLYNEGKSVGFEMSEEELAEVQEELDGLSDTAALYGYTDVNKYLTNLYGSSITMEILEKCINFISYANAYEESYKAAIEFTDDEINAQYEEDKNMYDSYEYRYFLVKAESVEETDYDSTEEYEAAKEAAQAEARALAESYVSKIKSEEDYIAVAKEYDSESYGEDDSTFRRYNGELLGSTYGDWLRDSSRKSGDMTTADISTGTYVVYFLNRSDNHYNTVNARMIVIPYDTVDADDYEDEEDDTAYNEAVAAEIEEARVKAEDLLQQWKDEGGGEELFGEYADDNTKESGYEGGLHENIPQYQYSDEINNWLYDATRVEGDTAIFYSENSGAYYIIYFSGVGEVYAEYLARTDLVNDAVDAWDGNLTENIEINKTWLFALEKAGTQVYGY